MANKAQIWGLVVILLAGITAGARGGPQYTVTAIDTRPGAVGRAINRDGFIAGYVADEGYAGGFVYDASGTRESVQVEYPVAINDSGTVFGYFYRYMYYGQLDMRDGVARTMGHLHSPVLAGGITNEGWIASAIEKSPDMYVRAAAGSIGSGSAVPIGMDGTLGGNTSWASGISDAGVVGAAETSDGASHAFLGRPFVTMRDLGTLGGTNSEARAINNLGLVVGWADGSDGRAHAFLYRGEAMQDLGTLGGNTSDAWAVNDGGYVVGAADLPDGSRHAFLSTGSGPMLDLNDLIVGSRPGWNLEWAAGINAGGQIVVNGRDPDGNQGIFLLTPVPEPSTLALLGIAAGLLSYGGWRRRGALRGGS